MRVLSEILDSTPMGYYLSFHILYRIDKSSVYGKSQIYIIKGNENEFICEKIILFTKILY